MPTVSTSDTHTPEAGTHLTPPPRPGRTPEAIAGRYVTFELAGQQYGVEGACVREIVGSEGILPLPRAPLCVRGLVEVRGRIVPVLDLRVRFGLDRVADPLHGDVIVLEYQAGPRLITTGVLVDRVAGSVTFDAASLVPVPELGGRDDEVDFLLGIGRHAGRVTFLLDAARVLSSAHPPARSTNP